MIAFILGLVPRPNESLMETWIRRQKTKEFVVIPLGTGALIMGVIVFCTLAPLIAVSLGWWLS